MNVNVLLRETIKPSKPTPNHLLYHHLSVLDHVNSPILMPLIFFYSPIEMPSLDIGINKMMNRLKESLATTLTIFYPLAGRFKHAHGHYIVCNDGGIPYVQGQVNRRLFEVVHRVEVSELDKLLPCKPLGCPSDLLLAIQVNVFSCGGIALGLCVNHKVSDAFSLYMFVKTWATIARDGACGNYLLPFFDAEKLFPLRNNCPPFKLKEEEVVTKRFVFSVKKLRNLVSKYSTGKQVVISSGLVLLAFIYHHIAANVQYQETTYEVFQAVNIRDIIEPPPSKHFYFGNIFVNALAKPTITRKDKLLIDIIDRMKEAMVKIKADFIREIQHGKEHMNFMIDHLERDKKAEITYFGFSNHCKLPVYESDFGWGRPVCVTSATAAVKNLIVFIPSPSQEEIQVYISLGKEDMNKLEKDREFISVTTIRPLSYNCKL